MVVLTVQDLVCQRVYPADFVPVYVGDLFHRLRRDPIPLVNMGP